MKSPTRRSKKRAPAKSVRRGTRRSTRSRAVAAVPVTAADLRALKSELERRLNTPTAVRVGKQRTAAAKTSTTGLRWNPEPEDVQKSVAQLVLTIVEFLRRLMERQAIRRMEQKTLTRKEVEAIGVALMTLEDTVRDIGCKFGLTPEDLNLDLGPLGKLM
ncbi:MAG TPA: gas vesicle protein K [Vicinamibacterales bacterium]